VPSRKSERTLDHQYLIRSPPDAVFRAITDPGWITRWLCDRAELAPVKGGRYRFGWTNGPTHTGKVVDFRPGQRIAFAWEWPGIELKGTVFALEVEAQEGGSLLRVTHSGFPRLEKWTELYAGAEWGWTYFAMNLKSVLENGHDLRTASDG
jgi:uncharacterized protein YndB with AHSA1/START domain